MKKVAITQKLDNDPNFGEIKNSLDIEWQKFLLPLNLIPIPIPIDIGLSSYQFIGLDGLILTGGNDLSSCSGSKISKMRDYHEISCIKYAIKNNIPIIGVCRGMQLIAEYFGSTLKKVKNHVNITHGLKTIDSSEDLRYIKKIEQVNSFHNYAIDNLSNQLSIVALSQEDNTIEAIKHKKYKIFAQMWHPERPLLFSKLNAKHFSLFFK